MNMSVVEKPADDATSPEPPATRVEKKRVILALPGDKFFFGIFNVFIGDDECTAG